MLGGQQVWREQMAAEKRPKVARSSEGLLKIPFTKLSTQGEKSHAEKYIQSDGNIYCLLVLQEKVLIKGFFVIFCEMNYMCKLFISLHRPVSVTLFFKCLFLSPDSSTVQGLCCQS